MSNFNVRKVAVLGAGVMGAQIAAHCVNARVPVLLFDLPDTKSGNKNGIVLRAIENLKKLSPAPLGKSDDAAYIEAANYEEHLELLKGCDLVIEAIAERIPTVATDAVILDTLETFLTSTLGKGVVRAKDTPNFIANRVGIFGMLATIHESEKFDLGYDVVDDLTGANLGRAKSATFRTADVVG